MSAFTYRTFGDEHVLEQESAETRSSFPTVQNPIFYNTLYALLFISVIGVIMLDMHGIVILSGKCVSISNEITCNCFNTTGWVRFNDTDCCLQASPSICQNTTIVQITDYNGKCIPLNTFRILSVVAITITIVVIISSLYILRSIRNWHKYPFLIVCIGIILSGIILLVIFLTMVLVNYDISMVC